MQLTQLHIERINRLWLAMSFDSKEWDESKHPRAENGQFGSGSSSKKKSSKLNFSEIFDIAISNQGGNKLFSDFAVVSKETVEAVKRSTGLDISGWSHSIAESDIRHIMKRHGDEASQEKLGQRAVTKADFEKLPEILSNFDSIQYEGLNNEHHHSFIVRKKLNGEIYCAQEVRTGRKKLVVKTMWIKKEKP